jgi:hypothetical protein
MANIRADEILERMKERAAAEAMAEPPPRAPEPETLPPEESGVPAEGPQTTAQAILQRLSARNAEDRIGKIEADVETLPELATSQGVTSGSFVGDLKTAAGLMFAASDEAKKDIIRENFPDVDIKEDERGVSILTFPDGRQAVLNKPGLSFQDVYGFLGDMAAFYGPAKLPALAKGLVKKIAIGGAAGAATQAGVEKGVQFLGSKQNVDPLSVGTAGVLGAGSELVEAGVKATAGAIGRGVRARRASQLGKELGFDVGPEIPARGSPGVSPAAESVVEMAEAGRVSDRTGIPLFRAQRSGDITDLARQERLQRLPGTARKAATAIKGQNEAAYKAVMDVLETVAPEKAVETAESRFRGAATDVIGAQKALRAEAASPFYREAFQNKTLYLPRKTLSLIDEEFKKTLPKSPIGRGLNRVRGLLKLPPTEGGVQKGFTVRQLHDAKRAIWPQILKARKAGDAPLARVLGRVQKSLLDETDQLSPNYKQARELFARESPAVNALEDSLIGTTGKLKDVQLKQVQGALFNPRNTPGTIVRAKNLIKDQDPDAWNAITRSYMESLLGNAKIAPDEVGNLTQNVPAQLLKALAGNPKQRKMLYAALEPETAKNFRYLEKGLQRASLGRAKTAKPPSETQQGLPPGVSGTLYAMFGFKGAAISRVASAALGAGRRIVSDKDAKILVDIMFDPKWRPDMEKLRKLNPEGPKAASFLRDVWGRAGGDLTKPGVQAAAPDLEN